MPTIPRYQSRGGPSVRGLDYAGAYAPPDGADWRTLAKAAEAAGTVLDLFKAAPKPVAQDAGTSTAIGTRPALTVEDHLLGKAREVTWRREQLAADVDALDAEVVGQSRRRAAEELPQGARTVFEALTAPREAGFMAAAAARAGERVREAWQALSLERQALGVDEYHSLIETAPEQAMAALGSATGELAARLRQSGADQAEIQAAQRELVSAAQAERVSRALDSDPDRAAIALNEAGALGEDDRRRLAEEIEAEQLRRGVQREVGRWVEGDPSLVDDPERMMGLAVGAGAGDEQLVALYQGSALSEMRAAQARTTAHEAQAWAPVERLLANREVRAWTDLKTRVWRNLSPAQQAEVRRRTEAPSEQPLLHRTDFVMGLPAYPVFPDFGKRRGKPPERKPVSPPPAARPAINPNLGAMSRFREVGNRGPEHIQRTPRDPVSYGIYQFTGDTARDFSQSAEAAAFADLFASRPQIDTAAYDKAWQAAAARDSAGFAKAQHDYFRRDHYDPFVADLYRDYGIDIGKDSYAMQDVLWSTRVHHGKAGAPAVMKAAIANSGFLAKMQGLAFLPDKDRPGARAKAQADLIVEIYKERGRQDANGVLVHFRKKPHLKKGLLARFRDEGAEALTKHKAETGLP